jgi:hypothetical protein
VPFAFEVDRRSAGPGCGRACVVRDAECERDDAHHFVQRWIAEARFERLGLYSVRIQRSATRNERCFLCREKRMKGDGEGGRKEEEYEMYVVAYEPGRVSWDSGCGLLIGR